MFISIASGTHCNDRVFDFSNLTFFFSYAMSFFTSSNQITNFLKSGPVQMLPDEKYGGHIMLLFCNMATILFKLTFVNVMNQWVNDSIYFNEKDFFMVTDMSVQSSTIRFVVILLICVLPSSLFVSNQFKLQAL